jgi:anaerobic selenocysteine-containing dehydrogenase
VTEHRTFCNICEAVCGMIATVEDGRVVKLRPDPEHPISRGFACPKGIAWLGVLEDPDRVVAPQLRHADGEFTPVSWGRALDVAGGKLRDVIAKHGTEAVGLYLGNPAASNMGAMIGAGSLVGTLKTKHFYTASSIDINNYYVTNKLLYGTSWLTPFPDISHTDFLLLVGANPLVSHGSMWTVGRVREQLHAVVARAGRVVVVDPRRTETAGQFEHLPIRPGSDVWLFAALLKVVLDEGLEDPIALYRQARNLEPLRRLVREIELDRAAAETGIATDRLVALAREFAAAPAASLHSRCGASLGRFSTLTRFLSEALVLTTGNLDRRGGNVIGDPWIDFEWMTDKAGLDTYDTWRTRVDGLPEVCGQAPMASLAREIQTPGRGQLRALITVCGNPATTGPGADNIRQALQQLDVLICVDPYITETSCRADAILPPTLWLEREGVPSFSQLHMNVPSAQWAPAVVPPRGDAKDDGWILDRLARAAGLIPQPTAIARAFDRLGLRLDPIKTYDLLVRIGPHGDRFGLRRRGLSRKRLIADGPIKLRDEVPTGVLNKRVRHEDHLIHLDHEVIRSEMRRLIGSNAGSDELPLRLISIRELRSQNSWLHNVEKLMRGPRQQHARLHPDDAAAHGISDGDEIVIRSDRTSARLPAIITDELIPGVVAVNHGWGHQGGWHRAVAAGGTTINALIPDNPEQVDQASGNAFVNGVPVAIALAATNA